MTPAPAPAPAPEPTTAPTPTTAPEPTPAPEPIVPAVTETTLFSDGFATFDASQWPARVITGTQDSTIKFSVDRRPPAHR